MTNPRRTEFTARFTTHWLPASLILTTIGCYFAFLYQHAINVPLADDIYDILQVVSGVITAPDKESALQILFAQHNDHRTFASRLMYYGIYLIQGNIDFRTLVFLANLALPLLLVLLYLMAPNHRVKCLLLLPAALILFQLRAYGITLWSMAAFAYFYVFLYGFCCLYCLHKISRKRFVLAIFLASAATFTLASGQVVWLVGFISLAHQSLIRRSASYFYPLCWTIAAAVVLVAWRLGLETPNTLLAMLTNFFNFPGHHVLYFLTLLGCAVTENSVALAAMAGMTMIAILVVCTVKSYREQDLRLELCCWFVVLSVAAIVLGRSFTSVDYALSSRYSFPSVLMLTTTWVLVAVRLNIKSRKLFLLAGLLAATYCVSSYHIYSTPLQYLAEKRVKNFNEDNYWAWPHPKRESNAIVAQAVSLGIYQPPSQPLPDPRIHSGGKEKENSLKLERK